MYIGILMYICAHLMYAYLGTSITMQFFSFTVLIHILLIGKKKYTLHTVQFIMKILLFKKIKVQIKHCRLCDEYT